MMKNPKETFERLGHLLIKVLHLFWYFKSFRVIIFCVFHLWEADWKTTEDNSKLVPMLWCHMRANVTIGSCVWKGTSYRFWYLIGTVAHCRWGHLGQRGESPLRTITYQEDSLCLNTSNPCPWFKWKWICKTISRDGDKGWILTWQEDNLFALSNTYQK